MERLPKDVQQIVTNYIHRCEHRIKYMKVIQEYHSLPLEYVDDGINQGIVHIYTDHWGTRDRAYIFNHRRYFITRALAPHIGTWTFPGICNVKHFLVKNGPRKIKKYIHLFISHNY